MSVSQGAAEVAWGWVGWGVECDLQGPVVGVGIVCLSATFMIYQVFIPISDS